MKLVSCLKGNSMREIFDRMIARLENISEYDDYGKSVELDEALGAVFDLRDDYEDYVCLTKEQYEELLEYKYMYEDLCR